MKIVFTALVTFSLTTVLFGQKPKDPLLSADSIAQKNWVDATYNNMTTEEKIGQLFMVMVTPKNGEEEVQRVRHEIIEQKLGGVIFSKGTAEEQLSLVNEFQTLSRHPLMIGMDAEWGPAMRLSDALAFPWNMTLGAIQDDSLLIRTGQAMGRQLKRIGVRLNFGPVVDVNINPNNPIIGNRSFGELPQNVTKKARLVLEGLRGEQVLGTLKHFPGHGDTDMDSHKTLPKVEVTKSRLDSVELYPYQQLVQEGVEGVMVAHLNIPALEAEKDLPTSMSASVTTQLLKKELGFRGLVITDALNMKGATENRLPGTASLQAFLAGNDVLIIPEKIEKSVQVMTDAYNAGVYDEERLETSVKKVLMAKYLVGLNERKKIPLVGLKEDMNSYEDQLLLEELIEGSLTTVQNKNATLPIAQLDKQKIAYIHFGEAPSEHFVNRLEDYAEITVIKGGNLSEYRSKLRQYNLVIVGLHKDDSSPYKSYKFSKNELFWLQEIASMPQSKTILSVFTSPYSLRSIVDFTNIDAITVGYQNNKLVQEKMAEMLFGAIPSKGKLPVSINSSIPAGTGIMTSAIGRLGFSFPERVGIDAQKLAAIDRIVQHGIDSLMMPGAQVLVARKGKVVYQKSFGKTTYESQDSVQNDHLYDLASLTKILSTLPLLMQQEDQGLLGLSNTLSDLLPELKQTKLKDVSVLKTLSHYGRLPAWIAFYASTLDKNKKPDTFFYRSKPEPGFSIQVAERLFLQDAYKDSIYNRIARQDLKSNQYRYSDVGYYIFKKYLENQYGKGLNEIVQEKIYNPLGIKALTYRPLEKYAPENIVPSEVDDYFRHSVLRGYVHDMGAAMQDGVGGHAGLFGNSLAVAKMMQMYLQGGVYGSAQLMGKRTVKKFNTCYFCHKKVRRGVGFDKPQSWGGGPACKSASSSSFGHSGFTGTYTWVDPEYDLVYVFLSNRTYPTMRNNLLVKTGLRTRVQQAIYDALLPSVDDKTLALSP